MLNKVLIDVLRSRNATRVMLEDISSTCRIHLFGNKAHTRI